MPTWLTIVLALGGSAAISTFMGFIITRILTKLFSEKDAEDRKKREEEAKANDDLHKYREQQHRKERIEDIQEVIAPVVERLNNIEKKLDDNTEGTLCTLRDEILNSYYDCVRKKYRNDYDYKNIHELYKAYDRLHGNCFVEDVMERFDKLPTKEEFLATEEVQKEE